MKASTARKIRAPLIGVLVIGVLFSAGLLSTITSSTLAGRTSFAVLPSDPLGVFQGYGLPASISWTGDGQQITNPSFETGSLSPWVQTEYNAAGGSGATLTTPGYNSTDSARLIVFSGNFSSNSYTSLLSDLTQQHVGFSSALRFRAAVQVQQVTGTSTYDRVEANLNLTTSVGGSREIHYVFANGGTLPPNSATDAYYAVGTAPLGQWTFIDRNVAADATAAFPTDYPNIDSVSQVTLTTLAQTAVGAPNHDLHIKYWNPNTTQFHSWQSGLPIVYDFNNNGVYDDGDYVLGGCTPSPCSPPPTGAPLYDDPLIKYVDANNTGVWAPGDPVVYDCNTVTCDTNIYSFYDPIIYGTTPLVGTLLAKIVHNHTAGLFDNIELYSATGGTEWIKNGGFSTGLTSWGPNSNFTISSASSSPGGHSAQGTANGYDTLLGQSIDAKPIIDTSMTFTTTVDVSTMTGTSSSDRVEVWLGLVDSQGNPISLYYLFKTGDGSMPANETDAVYHKVSRFGTTNQWLPVNDSLASEILALDLLGYSPPYSVEIVALEVAARGSSTTTANFENLSLHSASRTGTAPSIFHALDGLNTTYVYSASAIPQGALYLEIPGGESILNITTPERTTLQAGDYSTTVIGKCTINPCILNPRAVTIPVSTFFKHSPIGDWQVFATSTNPITTVYAEDPSTRSQASSINVGSTVNLVSQSIDPLSRPMTGVQVNLTLWNTATGGQVGSWPGQSNALGWWNVSSVTLPLTGTPPGIYRLQATVNATYAGVRTFQISVRYQVNISLSLSSTQISQGASTTISGIVTETTSSTPASDVNVTISYRLAGNSQWTFLANVTTDSSGHFSHSWSPPQGDYQVEATTGDSQTAPTQSSPIQLSVGGPGFLEQYMPILVAAGAAVAVIAILAVLRARRRTVSA